MSENPLWEDDLIQFARLLCEINATQDMDLEILAESMDLGLGNINDLFDRADNAWERAKGNR